jgi:hypothetical protein
MKLQCPVFSPKGRPRTGKKSKPGHYLPSGGNKFNATVLSRSDSVKFVDCNVLEASANSLLIWSD